MYDASKDDGASKDEDIIPLCTDRDTYNKQKERIKILNIVSGSILLQFEIQANRTHQEINAPEALDYLNRKLADPKSDFRHDVCFGRFASVAQLTEVPFSEAVFAQEKAEEKFEAIRGKYDKGNYCELHIDSKNNIYLDPWACPPPGNNAGGTAVRGLLFAVSAVWAAIFVAL
jgi:hypothetical protein